MPTVALNLQGIASVGPKENLRRDPFGELFPVLALVNSSRLSRSVQAILKTSLLLNAAIYLRPKKLERRSRFAWRWWKHTAFPTTHFDSVDKRGYESLSSIFGLKHKKVQGSLLIENR